MRQRGGGVIVNISSIAAFTLRNAYGISKLPVRGLTVALAQKFAMDNIRVYGIAPRPVDSQTNLDHLPAEMARNFIESSQLIKRQGRMQDLAVALKFLCSDDASFITGETLVVGGDALARDRAKA
jgi:3-oxoacyl-[acyl-carrier protein] reductase